MLKDVKHCQTISIPSLLLRPAWLGNQQILDENCIGACPITGRKFDWTSFDYRMVNLHVWSCLMIFPFKKPLVVDFQASNVWRHQRVSHYDQSGAARVLPTAHASSTSPLLQKKHWNRISRSCSKGKPTVDNMILVRNHDGFLHFFS